MIESNVVTNMIVWDSTAGTWTPPEGATMLIRSTTPASVWVLNTDKTAFELQTVMGLGDIGYTWDGTELHTNLPQPEVPVQPVTPN